MEKLINMEGERSSKVIGSAAHCSQFSGLKDRSQGTEDGCGRGVVKLINKEGGKSNKVVEVSC